MTAAELCRSRGWTVGTMFNRPDSGWTNPLTILYIGEKTLFFRDAKGEESSWGNLEMLKSATLYDPLAPVDYETARKTPGVYRCACHSWHYHSDGKELWCIESGGRRIMIKPSTPIEIKYILCPDHELHTETSYSIRKKVGG